MENQGVLYFELPFFFQAYPLSLRSQDNVMVKRVEVIGAMLLFFLIAGCGMTEEELVEEGRARMDEEKYEEAIKLFDGAISKNPDNFTAHNAKGVALIRVDKLQEAVISFNEAIRIDSGDYRAYYNRGNSKRLLEDDEGAMRDYDKAIEIKPDVTDAYVNRGAILAKYNEFDRALFDFEFALRLGANNPLLYLNKGKIELRINNPDDAIFDFKKAIEAKGDFGEAYYWLGMAEIARENRTEGCGYLQSAATYGIDEAQEAIAQNCLQ